MRTLYHHTVALSRALRAVQVSHALHNLLVAVGGAMTSGTGSASISELSISLGVSFEAVRVLMFANADLFEQVTDGPKLRTYLRQYRLSPEGSALLAKITKTTDLCLPTR